MFERASVSRAESRFADERPVELDDGRSLVELDDGRSLVDAGRSPCRVVEGRSPCWVDDGVECIGVGASGSSVGGSSLNLSPGVAESSGAGFCASCAGVELAAWGAAGV